MNTDLNPAATRLAKGKLQRLQDSRGLRVLCLGGTLWLTQEGDPRDIILEAGDEFVIDHDGASFLSALADSSVLLLCPSPAPMPARPANRWPLAMRWAARWE